MQCKHIIGFLILSLTFAACGRHRQAEALLMQADSLMMSRPDSAYALLDSVGDEARGTWGRADRMRYELTLAEAMNKAYVPFTTDSVMKLVARYYDRHGSHNEQLKAHYLLGCTYRDMGEAPAAINAWQEAVDCADTTSADCDYKTLYRVYGQMADIFHKRLLFTDEIQSRILATHYALLAQDTLNALFLQSKMGSTYILINKNDSAEYILKNSLATYERHGFIQQSFAAVSPLIYLYVHQPHHLSDAKLLMDRYEALSNDFDEQHELLPSKRQYYRYKGLYYEQLGQLDSAEYYYRKVYCPGMDYVSKDPMYKGLLSVFTKRHQADSIAKYAKLYGEANDSSIAIRDRELTAQMTATYSYSRFKKEASAQREKALKNTNRLIAVSVIALAITALSLSIILWYRKQQRQKQDELNRLEGELQRTKREFDNNRIMLDNLDFIYHEALNTINAMGLEQTRTQSEQETVTELKRRYSESEQALQNIIKNQSTHIDVLEQRLGRQATSEEQESLFSHPFIIRVREMAGTPKGELTNDDWNQLVDILRGYYPKLIGDLLDNAKVSNKGLKVCLLCTIFSRGKDMANLLNVSSGRVTNLKADLNEALFGRRESKLFVPNLASFYHVQLPPDI